MSLGGSIFTHNAVKFDYCIREALASLCAVCDEVVVLDAESEDETVDVLNECKNNHGNLKVVTGVKWDCAPNYARLAMLANEAKSHLKTDWHFMLQADEVIQEISFPYIRCATTRNDGNESYFCRRLNLFGDLNHYFGYDIPHHKKPCSDVVIRLAKTKFDAIGDAESLGANSQTITNVYQELIHIFHYGFVRRDASHIDKIMNMQSWFYGPGSTPDQRVAGMTNGIYDWTLLKEKNDLTALSLSHPKFSAEWAAERQKEKTILV